MHTAMKEAAPRTWETGSSLPVGRDHCTGHTACSKLTRYQQPTITCSGILQVWSIDASRYALHAARFNERVRLPRESGLDRTEPPRISIRRNPATNSHFRQPTSNSDHRIDAKHFRAYFNKNSSYDSLPFLSLLFIGASM